MKQDREEIKRRFSEEFGSREVTVIPANPIYEVNLKEKPEMVGAYCRVSTTAAEQAESYEMQRQQYMKTIASHPNWTLIDIYADEGVSGTSTKGRKDFQRLIDDCRAHKITLILTKSVTRFARNVVDCVETARQLKRLDPPVGIYFETSNIYTLDERSETLLNILASLAQSESEDEEAFWDVIRHEYAHALVMLRHPNERHGHDKVFYAACKEVGCNPSRLSNFAREESKQRRKEREKYIVQCKKCGAQWTYLRAGTVVKMIQMGRGSTLRCPKCNGSDWLLTEK